MCEAIIDLFRDEYDKGVEEAMTQGVQQGVLQGIDSFVLEYLEDGFEAESIIQKLMRRFTMTREQAEDTVNRLRDRREQKDYRKACAG